MFIDIWTARRNALSLSKTLMVVTAVIATGHNFSVITADELDSSGHVMNTYDPFA